MAGAKKGKKPAISVGTRKSKTGAEPDEPGKGQTITFKSGLRKAAKPVRVK